MSKRHLTFRSLLTAAILAVTSVLATVATALADGGGIPFPK
jgi:hypothetical protein